MVSKKALPTDHIPLLGRLVRYINRKAGGEISSLEGEPAAKREFDPSEQREKREEDFAFFVGS